MALAAARINGVDERARLEAQWRGEILVGSRRPLSDPRQAVQFAFRATGLRGDRASQTRSVLPKRAAKPRRSSQLHQFGARHRSKAPNGLIHKQDGRIGGQSASHAHALPLSAGEFVREALGEFGGIQSNERQHLTDAFANARVRPAFEARHERHISLDSPVRE